MRDLPPGEVYEYAAEDADVTLKLKNLLEPKLKEAGVWQLFTEVEMPLVRVLAAMEMNGVRLDTASLRETSQILTQRMTDIEQEIYRLAGEEFNIASPRQVGEILFGKMKIVEKPKKTKTGQYVTSEEVLQQLRGKSEIVGKILEHRGLKKLLGTYVDALPKLVNPRTGHIHTSFNQTVTATGRLSSSDPNLQNIPVRGEDGKEIRKAFVPEEGCLFFSADYSQIEPARHGSPQRRREHAGGLPRRLRHPRRHGRQDLPRDDGQRYARPAHKGQASQLRHYLRHYRVRTGRTPGHQPQGGHRAIDGYFATFPKVAEYMEQAKATAREKGYAETLLHRRRYLPDIASHNATVRGFAERNAINAPIQGTAADIIKIAMVRIYDRFKKENIRSKMILQVHDELNFSVLPDERGEGGAHRP